MIHAQAKKVVPVVPPQAIKDNAAWTTTSVDTKDWEYATLYVMLGATDIALAALKVQESDDDGVADAYADIDELDFSDATQLDIDGAAAGLPAADDDNKVFAFQIDLRGRKRYLDLVATAGDGATGTYLAAWCELSRGKIAPVTAAEQGCEQILRV